LCVLARAALFNALVMPPELFVGEQREVCAAQKTENMAQHNVLARTVIQGPVAKIQYFIRQQSN